MIRGRPVVFLVTVLGGWTALRVTMAFTIPAVTTDSQVPILGTTDRPPVSSTSALSPQLMAARVEIVRAVPAKADIDPQTRRSSPRSKADVAIDGSPEAVENQVNMQPVFAETPRPHLALNRFALGAGLSPLEAGLPPVTGSGRWAGSAWMLWRNDDRSAEYARGPRLGGSQAGVRIDYALAPDSALRPAVYGRLSSALRSPAAVEIASGFAIRPRLPLPLTLAVERREGLSPGGRSAFALLAAGGINPVEIGHGFRLDGYAQAGVVGFRRRDGFADGRLTVERPVADAPVLAVGAGIWGGVQPGVSRLDIGPQASLRLHVGDSLFRFGAEWREQVAGNATPRSGPALSIGTDF